MPTTVGQDTFTFAGPSDVQTHTPNIGASWSNVDAGATWNGQGTYLQPYCNTAFVPTFLRFNTSGALGNDQAASFDFLVGSPDDSWYICVRGDSTLANCYALLLDANNGRVALGKFIAGTFTLLSGYASVGYGSGVYHNFKISAIGSTLVASFDGTVVLTVTDTAIASGSYSGIGLFGINTGYRSELIDNWLLQDYSVAAVASLIVTTQPTTTASGNLISPSVVVKATTDGTTVDTTENGPCPATLPGGALYGTTTVNFASGVATFAALAPGGAARTDALHFTRTGFTAVDSAAFAITSGSGSTTPVATEDDMQYDTRALSAAGLMFSVNLANTDGTPATGKTFSTVVCALSVDGALPVAQTLVTMTLGAYTSLGFKEQSATLDAGGYAFCPATLPAAGKMAKYVFTGTGLRKATYAVTLLAGDDGRAAQPLVSDIGKDAADRVMVSISTARENAGGTTLTYDKPSDGTAVVRTVTRGVRATPVTGLA